MLPLPVQLFGPELAEGKNLKLHVVGAVYGAKLDWSTAHNGREPPAGVVRLPKACPRMVDKLYQGSIVSPCSNLCARIVANILYYLRVAPRERPAPYQNGLALNYATCLPIHHVALLHPAGGCLGPAAGFSPARGAHQPAPQLEPPLLDTGVQLDNRMRHACAGALIRRLASDMLPPDVSTVTREDCRSLVDDRLLTAAGGRALPHRGQQHAAVGDVCR